MPDGSLSDAPVMRPGPSSRHRSRAQPRVACRFPGRAVGPRARRSRAASDRRAGSVTRPSMPAGIVETVGRRNPGKHLDYRRSCSSRGCRCGQGHHRSPNPSDRRRLVKRVEDPGRGPWPSHCAWWVPRCACSRPRSNCRADLPFLPRDDAFVTGPLVSTGVRRDQRRHESLGVPVASRNGASPEPNPPTSGSDARAHRRWGVTRDDRRTRIPGDDDAPHAPDAVGEVCRPASDTRNTRTSSTIPYSSRPCGNMSA